MSPGSPVQSCGRPAQGRGWKEPRGPASSLGPVARALCDAVSSCGDGEGSRANLAAGGESRRRMRKARGRRGLHLRGSLRDTHLPPVPHTPLAPRCPSPQSISIIKMYDRPQTWREPGSPFLLQSRLLREPAHAGRGLSAGGCAHTFPRLPHDVPRTPLLSTAGWGGGGRPRKAAPGTSARDGGFPDRSPPSLEPPRDPASGMGRSQQETQPDTHTQRPGAWLPPSQAPDLIIALLSSGARVSAAARAPTDMCRNGIKIRQEGVVQRGPPALAGDYFG